MMNRRRFGLLAAVAPAVLLSSCALAGCGTQDKAEIEKAYVEMDTAAKAKDATKMFSYYADDFSAQGPGGSMNKQAAQAQIQQAFTLAQSIDAKSTVEKVEVSGDKATATVKGHLEMTINNPMTGKPSKLVVDTSGNDTWGKKAGAWKMTGSQQASTSMTIDGKAMPAMPGMPGVK